MLGVVRVVPYGIVETVAFKILRTVGGDEIKPFVDNDIHSFLILCYTSRYPEVPFECSFVKYFKSNGCFAEIDALGFEHASYGIHEFVLFSLSQILSLCEGHPIDR